MPEATSGHGFIIWAIMWVAVAAGIAAIAGSSPLASNIVGIIILILMTWPFFVSPIALVAKGIFSIAMMLGWNRSTSADHA
jgi:ABC-type Na+ efflux pump permease subunit